MQSTILTVVVTINTLVKPQPSLAMPHKVKKPVLLLLAELDFLEEPSKKISERNDLWYALYLYGVQKLWVVFFFKL